MAVQPFADIEVHGSNTTAAEMICNFCDLKKTGRPKAVYLNGQKRSFRDRSIP
jgi:hypothetical protein